MLIPGSARVGGLRRRRMRKSWVTVLALVLAVSFTGCSARQTRINAYVLPGGNISGDADKGVAPIEGVVVWPFINIAVGNKAKGVELALTDYLVDTLYLKNTFKSVYILNEAEAKDLLARAGEELGLKKKPKDPSQNGLVTSKIGQLTDSQAILVGRIDDYDEVKVDKNTYTAAGLSFFLYDAREQAYATLDSFTPTRALWRTNAIRTSKETPFLARKSIYETVRVLMRQVVDRLEKDLVQGTAKLRKAQQKKIEQLKKQASKQRKDGEFDGAIASWNAILRIDAGYPGVPEAIETLEAEKKDAEEREKARQLQEQIAGVRGEAAALEKAGDLEAAIEQWEKVLELDKGDQEAGSRIETLNETLAAREAAEKEKELGANLHIAQKALGEMKYTEAVDAARKVLALEPDNTKAKEIIEVAEQKLGEARAAEEEMTSSPVEEPEAVKEPEAKEPEAKKPEAKKPEKAPEEGSAAAGGSPEAEKIRNEAMELFNSEDYAAAEEAWKRLLQVAPDDKQAQEMLETTQMLIEALQ
jgi:tetratricopeptide (TPR) repeat protein